MPIDRQSRYLDKIIDETTVSDLPLKYAENINVRLNNGTIMSFDASVIRKFHSIDTVSYTHLTLPTTPYV